MPGAALLAGALIAPPSAANAAVTLGQLPPDAPAATCSSSADYLQPSVTGGNLYNARQAGTITSWSTMSSGAGARYVFKVFRRTGDPDVFQVVGLSDELTLIAGLNTFPVDLQVKSGDMIGLHEEGPGMNSCTFPTFGDAVLRATGDVGDGGSATFGTVQDVRLNLSAVLVPTNSFAITGITHHRRNGTATVTAEVPNPGVFTLAGRGVRGKHRTIAVAGPVSFRVAVTAGKLRRRLARRGRLHVPLTLTFFPTGGDPSSQTVSVRLRVKRRPVAV